MTHDIYLRCHTSVVEPPKVEITNRQEKWPEYVLVFDTETTIDGHQQLTFGAYRFCQKDENGNYTCLEEGLFYADSLDQKSLGILQHYVKTAKPQTLLGSSPKLKLYKRSDFMEQVFLRAVAANAFIVAYNLPFDLSRLSVEYRVGRRAGNRSWSFVLFEYFDSQKNKFRPNTFRPRVQLTPKDSKAAFVRLAGGDKDQPFRAGRFLDVKTLLWALRNKNLSLENACHEFGVAGKLDHKPSGKVSTEEIDYCREDVAATVRLLNVLRVEFDRYPVSLAPEKAFSAASIAKAFLSTMGLVPPSQKFELSDYAKGVCMQAYYGGRAEIRVRHAAVPVVYTDFVSQYPTVNTLLGMWGMLTASSLREEDATESVKRLLDSITLDKLFDPAVWPELAFFALVQPNEDILPVRTTYGDGSKGQSTNIGLNPLTSAKPIWFAGPDVVASLLLTGHLPKIVRAVRFVSVGKQKNMKPVVLGDISIDPNQDIFFKKVIEERKRQKKNDSIQYFLKILANAGCYGIYAEVNRQQVGKNNAKELAIHSGEFEKLELTTVIEQPGSWYFPPMAALTTAGGRLLLAMLEKEVTIRGGTYLMCDTDSMAIVATEKGGVHECEGGDLRIGHKSAIKSLSWKTVDSIVGKFAALNPYDQSLVKGSILKVEDVNFDQSGKRREVFGYGVSAKRYALFSKTSSTLQVLKPSEHGLGLYLQPLPGRDEETNCPKWIVEAWTWIVCRALGMPIRRPSWFSLPVMRRIAISTPQVMKALRRVDRDRAKPYNFALSPVLVNLGEEPVTLLAPFEKDPKKWLTMAYINIHDGELHTLQPPTVTSLPQTFDMVLSQYEQHVEAKSLAPDGERCLPNTTGLLGRYPVTASGFQYIGKETERGWEYAEDVSTLMPNLIRYEASSAEGSFQAALNNTSLSTLENRSGLSRHTIINARQGKKVHPRTLAALRKALSLLHD